MKIYFSDNFKKELKTYGSYIKLSMCRLGQYSITGEVEAEDLINLASSDYIDYNSLWYSDTKSLNVTLDLSKYAEIPELEETNTLRTAIYFYYCDINDNLIDIAFVIWGDGEKLNLCADKTRYDLNYFTINLPKDTIANIETIHDEEFLESCSNLVGVNTFLAINDEYSSEDYITKDSYHKYARTVVSSNNYDPLFLNSNGEKVYSITSYKHYKSISIKSGLSGKTFENGDISYYTSGEATVNILGTCTYDLYEVSNNVYKLVKENCTEDISSATIYQILNDGISSTGIGCNINQINKTIVFQTRTDSEKASFLASMSFTSEIGSTSGKVITLRSNTLNFITYLSWTVEYSTNLTQEDENGKRHALLLFNNTANNSGWDVEGNNKAGYIVITSESELRDPSTDIIVTSDDSYIFDSFFTYEIESDGYDETNKRWRYIVKLKTLLNCSGKDWYPVNSEGASQLILNTIKIRNSEKSTSDVSFYCVQRTKYPLQLRRFQGGAWSNSIEKISFSGEGGVRAISDIYICNPIDGYPYWEILSDNIYFGLSYASSRLANSTEKPINIKSSTLYTKATSIYKNKELGTLVIRRNNENNSYDKHNWKDLIYCSPDNNIELTVEVAKNPNYTNTNRVDSGTEYFYEDKKLYIFDRYSGKSQKFEIIMESSSDEIPDIDYISDNKELFERYFEITIEKSKRSEYLLDNDIYIYNNNLEYNRQTPIYNDIPNRVVSYSPNYRPVSIGENTYYTDSNISSDNIDALDADRTNTGLVGIIPKQEVSQDYVESNLYNVNVYTVTITPKIINDPEDRYEWLPKRTSDNKTVPVSVTVGPEKFYCVIKPDFSNTVRFYENKTEITSLHFNKSNIVDSNGTKRKGIYISSTCNSSDFNYWYVYKKDPEISVRCETHGYGSQREFQLITDDISTWTGEEQTTILSTNSIPTSTEDYNLDSLIIKRSTYKYDNLLDLYNDWMTQLVEDYEFPLSLYVEGLEPTSSLEVLIADEEGNTTKLEDDDDLELDRLGIYKIYVKSSNKFRVILSGNDDNFYFFDIDRNNIKRDILMQDESRFDDIFGREVCFAFLGKEKNNFETIEQRLSTTITIVDLGNNSSMVLHLHRKYFNNRNENTGELVFPVLDSNITTENSIRDIFFEDNKLQTTLTYLSYIETYPVYSGTGRIKQKEELVQLNYGNYSVKGVIGTNSFISRGYVNTVSELEAVNLICPDSNYPIHPSGTISLEHKNNFNKRQVDYSVYKLIGASELIVDKESIDLPYSANRNSIIQMRIPESGEYVVEATIDGEEWTEIPTQTPGSGIPIKVTLGDIKISKYGSDEEWMSFIIEGPDTEYEAENTIIIGSMRFRLYVDANRFIYDKNGSLVTTYTQEMVNDLVPPSSKVVSIRRLSRRESFSSISGDFITPISNLGETREFTVSKIDPNATISVSSESYFASEPIIVGEKISIAYKDRLTRFGYNNGRYIRYVANSSSIINDDSLNYLRNFSTNTESTETDTGSNFTVTVSGIKEETIEVTNLKQQPWLTGIRYARSRYDSTRLFMGTDNRLSISAGSTGGEIELFIDTVNLPTVSNIFSVIATPIVTSNQSNVNVQLEPYTTSLSNINTPKYRLRITLPENESVITDVLYRFTIQDGLNNENSINLTVTVPAKNNFSLYAFSKYESNKGGTYNFVTQDKLSDVAISASGRMSVPNRIYVITDAPQNYCNFELKTDSGYIFNSMIRTADGANAFDRITGCNFNNSIDSIYLGKATYNGNSYSAFYIFLYSKLNYVTLKTGIEIENCIGYVPYTNSSANIVLSGRVTGKSDNFTLRYGVCNVSLEGPYETHLSVKLWDENNISVSDVEKFANFMGSVDTTENAKYISGTNPSYLKSNKKKSSYNNNVSFDNYIWISYLDSSPYKYPLSLFESYGYYCGFRLFVNRKEWKKVGDSWEIVEPSTHVLQSMDGSKLLVSNGVSKSIYKDHLESEENIASHTRSNGNPQTIGITKYYSNIENFRSGIYGTGMSDITFPQDSTGTIIGAGVVFDIDDTRFSLSGDTRSYTPMLSTYSFIEDSINNVTDSVTFYVNISLVLKDE